MSRHHEVGESMMAQPIAQKHAIQCSITIMERLCCRMENTRYDMPNFPLVGTQTDANQSCRTLLWI